jgi:hypothetical protein
VSPMLVSMIFNLLDRVRSHRKETKKFNHPAVVIVHYKFVIKFLGFFSMAPQSPGLNKTTISSKFDVSKTDLLSSPGKSKFSWGRE